MDFFERLWNITLQKWSLFVDYWYVWVISILVLFLIGFVTSRKK
ncbi:hypothetical protein [Bacillus cereus]|nr:hypothetical protein [Bacillus cereus]